MLSHLQSVVLMEMINKSLLPPKASHDVCFVEIEVFDSGSQETENNTQKLMHEGQANVYCCSTSRHFSLSRNGHLERK